jgi:hypothetical protein
LAALGEGGVISTMAFIVISLLAPPSFLTFTVKLVISDVTDKGTFARD